MKRLLLIILYCHVNFVFANKQTEIDNLIATYAPNINIGMKIINLTTDTHIPQSILNNREVDSARFVNRQILLGDKCS